MEPLTVDAVRADIAAQLYLEPDELSETANLFQEGLDSVGLIELLARWRERGAEVSFTDLAEAPTLQAWWTVLARAKAGDE